jgi:hypothetical protein
MWVVEDPTFSTQSSHTLRWNYQPYSPATLYPQEVSWYSFLLEAEWPQGHSVAGKIRSIEKSNGLIGNRTSDFPVCSIVSQLPQKHGGLVISPGTGIHFCHLRPPSVLRWRYSKPPTQRISSGEHLRIEFVPHRKHTPSPLWKPMLNVV